MGQPGLHFQASRDIRRERSCGPGAGPDPRAGSPGAGPNGVGVSHSISKGL